MPQICSWVFPNCAILAAQQSSLWSVLVFWLKFLKFEICWVCTRFPSPRTGLHWKSLLSWNVFASILSSNVMVIISMLDLLMIIICMACVAFFRIIIFIDCVTKWKTVWAGMVYTPRLPPAMWVPVTMPSPSSTSSPHSGCFTNSESTRYFQSIETLGTLSS